MQDLPTQSVSSLVELVSSLKRFTESCAQSFELIYPGPPVSRQQLTTAVKLVYSHSTKIGLLFGDLTLPDFSLAESLINAYQTSLGEVCMLLSSVHASGEKILRGRIHDEAVAFFGTIAGFAEALRVRCLVPRPPKGRPILDPTHVGMVRERCTALYGVELTNQEAISRRVEQCFSQICDAQREINEVLASHPTGVRSSHANDADGAESSGSGKQDGETDDEADDAEEENEEDDWTAAELAAVPVVGLLIKVGSSLIKKVLTAVIPVCPLPPHVAITSTAGGALVLFPRASTVPPPPDGSLVTPAAMLDALVPLCAHCAEAADRLLVAMYPPQSEDSLSATVREFVEECRAVLRGVRRLATAVEGLSPASGQETMSIAWADVVEKLLSKGEHDFRCRHGV